MGRYLIPLLQEKGHDCILFKGDIRDKNKMIGLRKEKVDAVIHLAAKLGGRGEKLFYEVNVEGTRNLIEMCGHDQLRCFIFLSSIRVLSSQQNPYSLSKKAAEEIVVGSGAPYIILRPSLLYGKGDQKNLGFFFALINRLPVVPILNFKIQPLFVGDLAKIIAGCLEFKTNQIINIVGRETASLADILRSANFLANGHSFILRLPRCFAYLLKLISWCPGFPFSWQQIRPLLSSEIFSGDPWWNLFKIEPTRITAGLKQILKQ